jgi:membrane protein implicated in regulation of membrane protease activity
MRSLLILLSVLTLAMPAAAAENLGLWLITQRQQTVLLLLLAIVVVVLLIKRRRRRLGR